MLKSRPGSGMATVTERPTEWPHDPREQGLMGLPLADHYGLSQSGKRPSLVNYVRSLWQRRHFIVAFASARNIAMYTNARLGQVWQMLTPLFNVGVYFLIYTVIIPLSRGIPNYISYLVAGVFVFNFTQSAILAGSRSVSDNLGVIRALHFPRASLPVATTVIQLQQLGFSMVILCVVVLATGEPLTFNWFLIIPTLLLQFTFNTGISLLVSRAGATVTDLAALLPFLLRTWMYLSGVIYSVHNFADRVPHMVLRIFDLNPAYIYIALVRHALISENVTRSAGESWAKWHKAVVTVHETEAVPPHVWATAFGWAIVMGIAGFVYFWRAEERYGRG
jgi:teichoic acid transport system permease protein